ncbi:MAG: hypothetical protein FD148_343 [Methylocystaceae bacterium]|nr:MAG: hypothetical protein FD148_343 [Methylocystaceae bacterium]
MSNDGIDIVYVNQGVAGNNVPECNAAKTAKTRTLTPLILVRIQVPQPNLTCRERPSRPPEPAATVGSWA